VLVSGANIKARSEATMSEPTITCPNCSTDIPLTESLAAPLLRATKAKYEQALARKDSDLAGRERSVREQQAAVEHERAAIGQTIAEKLETERQHIAHQEAAKAKRFAATEVASKMQEIAELTAVLQDRDAKLAAAMHAQAELVRKERELEDARRGMKLTIETKVQAELGNLRKMARQEAEVEARLPLIEKEEQIASMKQQIGERDAKLAVAQQAQADVIRKERALDDARREMDLTIQCKVQAELKDIRLQARQEAEAEVKLPLLEKEQQIASMQRQIEDLKRKAEQGSQQSQGEAQELHLEMLLRAKFPRDLIEPVPKGEFGGDILQRVMGIAEQPCGTILWECKRTKNFSDAWLAKLREDQRRAGADVALIVTSVMPKGIQNFEFMDGIWVTDARCALPVALMLRQSLINIAAARQASEGQQTKMELVYRYLTGPRFRHRVGAVVERFVEMQLDLERERRSATKQFAKRDQQIRSVIEAMAGMVGDMQGIAGKAVEEIEALTMPLLDGRSAGGDRQLDSGVRAGLGRCLRQSGKDLAIS
jgi:hypothetical protein